MAPVFGILFAGCGDTGGGNKTPPPPAATVTITGTGLSNGANIHVVLFSTQDEAKAMTADDIVSRIFGRGAVMDGSVTVSLGRYDDNFDLIPWSAGGAWYVVYLNDDGLEFYVTKAKQIFANDLSLSVAFSAFDQFTPQVKDQAGAIKGRVTFTGTPDPKPEVKIASRYSVTNDDNDGNNPVDGSGMILYPVTIDDSGNGSFEIPFTQPFLTTLRALQGQETLTLVFLMRIGSGASSYDIVPPVIEVTASNLSDSDLTVSLADVSLASITLSGTLKVTYNGTVVHRVTVEVIPASQRVFSTKRRYTADDSYAGFYYPNEPYVPYRWI